MSMKIYISGPITGTDNFMERFEKVEQEYKELGHEVINPAKLNLLLPESTTHSQYMSMCYPMMDMCDTIVLMHGWEESKGAIMEIEYAIGKKLKIIDQDGILAILESKAKEIMKQLRETIKE